MLFVFAGLLGFLNAWLMGLIKEPKFQKAKSTSAADGPSCDLLLSPKFAYFVSGISRDLVTE